MISYHLFITVSVTLKRKLFYANVPAVVRWSQVAWNREIISPLSFQRYSLGPDYLRPLSCCRWLCPFVWQRWSDWPQSTLSPAGLHPQHVCDPPVETNTTSCFCARVTMEFRKTAASEYKHVSSPCTRSLYKEHLIRRASCSRTDHLTAQFL